MRAHKHAAHPEGGYSHHGCAATITLSNDFELPLFEAVGGDSGGHCGDQGPDCPSQVFLSLYQTSKNLSVSAWKKQQETNQKLNAANHITALLSNNNMMAQLSRSSKSVAQSSKPNTGQQTEWRGGEADRILKGREGV